MLCRWCPCDGGLAGPVTELSDEQAGTAHATAVAAQSSTTRRNFPIARPAGLPIARPAGLPIARPAGLPADRCGPCQIRPMRER